MIKDREDLLSEDEWGKLERLLKQQLKNKQYTEYTDPAKAKEHSRKLQK